MPVWGNLFGPGMDEIIHARLILTPDQAVNVELGLIIIICVQA